MGVLVEKPIVVEDSYSRFADGKFENETLTGLDDRGSHLIFDFPTVYVVSAKRRKSHPIKHPYMCTLARQTASRAEQIST